MSAILPVNIAGLALIGLALILFIIDIFSPTHGILTGGGILAFFLGAIMLFNRAGPGFTLSLGYVVPATLLTAAFFVFVAGAGVRAQMLPVRAGKETMLGRTAEALTAITSTEGKVFVEGEYWFATSETPIVKGSVVEIVGIKGLTLVVRPKTSIAQS
jgi:membrane-bound serine protease (ClpP class)